MILYNMATDTKSCSISDRAKRSELHAEINRSIVSVDADLSENEMHCRRVLTNPKERSMHDVKLIVSDSHDWLRALMSRSYLPEIP